VLAANSIVPPEGKIATAVLMEAVRAETGEERPVPMISSDSLVYAQAAALTSENIGRRVGASQLQPLSDDEEACDEEACSIRCADHTLWSGTTIPFFVSCCDSQGRRWVAKQPTIHDARLRIGCKARWLHMLNTTLHPDASKRASTLSLKIRSSSCLSWRLSRFRELRRCPMRRPMTALVGPRR
jgi:hypothetical protein